MSTNPKITEAPAADESAGASGCRASTAPTSATNPKPRPGRPGATSRPYHFGLVLTDAILFHPRLSHAAKLVLAATLAYPNRDASLTQLEAATALRRKTIIDAQNELEREGVAEYDRPRHPWERHPTNPRFQRSTRLSSVAPEADPSRAANRRKTIELPGSIAVKLPRGQKNAALFPLVALFYTREQLRRGAIQAEDEAVGAMLRLGQRQVQRIRQALRRDLLAFARREAPAEVFTFPGATVREPDAAALDAAKTRRLVPLQVPCLEEPVPLYANTAELAHAGRRTRSLGPHQTAAALARLLCRDFAAVYRDEGEQTPDPLPLSAADLLDALAAIEAEAPEIFEIRPDPCEISEDTEVDRSGTLSHTVREPGLLPPTSNNEELTRSAREEQASTKDGSAWPESVVRRAVEVFGARAVVAGTRTNQMLDRSIAHALSLWSDVYGPLAGEREQYAAERLCAAFDYLAEQPDGRVRFGMLRRAFTWVANHEDTHAGFRARPWSPAAARFAGTVDVSAELDALLDTLRPEER